MADVISTLEHTLSQTHEPELRQQLIDTIERLRKRKLREERRAQRHGSPTRVRGGKNKAS